MRRLVVLPLAVLALAVAGCGGSDDDGASTGSGASAAPSTAADAPASGNVVTVGMKDIQFAPKDVTVKFGQTVRWVNQEDVPHNVTATKGETFRSDNFSKGGSFEFKPTKAGRISYVCTIHPGMDGTLTVTK